MNIWTMTLKSQSFLEEETKSSKGRFNWMPEQDKQVKFLEDKLMRGSGKMKKNQSDDS